MNAKETLQKIAEALNIVDAEPKVEAQEIENTTEVVESEAPETVTEEVKAEEPAVEQPEAEAKPEQQEQSVEDKAEAEEAPKEVKDDSRVAELERQLADLKEILKNAMGQPAEEEKEIPEPPKAEEPKGLTHSPEKAVSSKAKGIGNKGGDIMSRVFKYMNN